MKALEPEQPHGWQIALDVPMSEMENSFNLPTYDDALDDVRSLLMDLCGALAASNARFIVVSPESGAWPVDVATDLPVVIEQIPEFLGKMQDTSCEHLELDFYEQGIQRPIELHRSGEMFDVVCFSGGHSPAMEKSICEVAVLYRMIVDFWEEFCRAAEKVAPLAVQHPWWRDWAAGLK